MMGCGYGGWHGSGGLGHILVLLTSGPFLGLLAALVLLLAAIALLKFIFVRRAPTARPAPSKGAT